MPNSVPYDHDEDSMVQPDPNDPTVLRKASFIKSSVLNFLATWGNANKFVIGTAPHSTGVETFTIKAINDDEVLAELPAQFPCPKNCIPPGEIQAKNTFDRQDLINAMIYSDCHYLNIHKATKGPNIESLCCYGVCLNENGELYSRVYRGDNIFISQTNTL